MMKQATLVALLASLPSLGCGDDQAVDNGGTSSGSPDADTSSPQDGGQPSPTDDGDDDDNESGDEDPQDDEPEPSEEPFEVPKHEVRLLPYDVRVNNLAALLAVETDHFLFDEIHTRRTLLGDHDYANGVAPDLSWSANKMGAWLKGLKPICSSALWIQRYPNLRLDPAPLLRKVLAREPNTEELQAYAVLATSASSTTRADELTCLAALSSLDFVAQ